MSAIKSSPVLIPVQRIRHMSLILSHFCVALVAGLPVVTTLVWLFADQATLASHVSGGLPPITITHPLHFWQRLAGTSLTLVQLGFLLVGLWHVRHCFRAFADGRFFGREVVVHLRRFAAWVCVSSVASLLGQPVFSVLLTIYNPVGQRQLTVGVNTAELFALFIAGTIWLIAAVMTHASALADENALFV